DVDRPVDVKVTAFDVTGESFELEATDLLGRCIQHENDHLDGILIPSRVSTLRRLGIRSALKELEDEWKPVQ
ncbi:MAG: peptide deformylase, partial [Planctomycetia bacterium]|nr:peptide deformylase [Planctomycetia bacterium]